MTSIERVFSVLREGVETVQRAIDSMECSGVGYERVMRLVEASRRITWAYEQGGAIYAAETGVVTDVQVAVLGGSPPTGVGLDTNSTFQTREVGDGYTRIYVRRRPYTPTWAGIVLFHELDHLLDHLHMTWPRVATREDWWAAEARAYHREVLIIDAVSGGGLLPILSELVSGTNLDELLGRQPHDLGDDLYRHAFPAGIREPAASQSERWARTAGLALGATVTTADAYPTSLVDLVESTAGPQLRRAARLWGWGTVQRTS